jgi:hypothetical protein
MILFRRQKRPPVCASGRVNDSRLNLRKPDDTVLARRLLMDGGVTSAVTDLEMRQR